MTLVIYSLEVKLTNHLVYSESLVPHKQRRFYVVSNLDLVLYSRLVVQQKHSSWNTQLQDFSDSLDPLFKNQFYATSPQELYLRLVELQKQLYLITINLLLLPLSLQIMVWYLQLQHQRKTMDLSLHLSLAVKLIMDSLYSTPLMEYHLVLLQSVVLHLSLIHI